MWFDRGLLILVLASASPASAEPAKIPVKRHGYDFTRPDPGDILPNPTEAVGAPPRLRAYATVKEMTSGGTAATALKPGVQTTIPAIGAPPREPERRPTARASTPIPTPPEPPSATGNGTPTASSSLITQHVQKTLAGQLAARGLGSRLVYHPSPLAETDPEVRDAEEQAWRTTVASLTVSWQAWQVAHAAAGPPQRKATSDPSPILRAPGVVRLDDAPPSVTGDLPDLDQ